jgi:hypothetical protein
MARGVGISTVYVWRPLKDGKPIPEGHTGLLAKLTGGEQNLSDWGHAALGLPRGRHVSFYPEEEAKSRPGTDPLTDVNGWWSPSLARDKRILKRPPDTEIKIKQLHVGAIEKRLEELRDEKYCAFAYNCSSVVADCLEAGTNGWEDERLTDAIWVNWRQLKAGFSSSTWKRMGKTVLLLGFGTEAAQNLTGRERYYSGLVPGLIVPMAQVYADMLN